MIGDTMSTISNSIRVLHADAEPDFADRAATFLERKDERFEIEIATSPQEGLNRLDDNSFDCIVSDYDMPDQNGIEFLEAVREDYSDLPFILYTGKGSEVIASDAISAGITHNPQKRSGTSECTVLANRIRRPPELGWDGEAYLSFLGEDGELDVERAKSTFREAGYAYDGDRLVTRGGS
ncbi:MAG: response regulator [Halodesulfurarchaeum sp.]